MRHVLLYGLLAILLEPLLLCQQRPAPSQAEKSAEPARGTTAETVRGSSPPAAARTVPNNTFFVPWQDPREGAFRVGVPQGWQVSGGTFRAASVDVRHVVQARSPDGQIRVSIDDPDLRPRQIPDAFMLQSGFREGQVIQGAWGGPILLSRYQTGAQFAQQYIRWKLCPNAEITQASDLRIPSAEMNARIQPFAASQGSRAQANVGEAYFRCGNAVGYVMATTLLAAPASGFGVQMWFVYQLGSVMVSDAAQAPFAAYVLHTMQETLAMNRNWEARQAQLTQDVTGAVTRMQQAMARSIAQYAQRQASAASAGGLNHPNDGRLPTDLRAKWAGEDRLSQQRQDTTMGQAWYHSSDGSNVRVDNSNTHWWRDAARNVYHGPASGDPPQGCLARCEKLQPGWSP